MRNTFVFTKTRRRGAQWCFNLNTYDSDGLLFYEHEAFEIVQNVSGKVQIKTFTVVEISQ